MILYPVARDPLGAPIHIDEWQRGQPVTCFGCGDDLVGRLPHDGIKPTAHFAHKADTECNGETALHKAAKAAITHAHAKGSLPFLSWECPHCKRCAQQTDLRHVVLQEEARPCEGVLSDVLGVDASGTPVVAVEVVVTHDIEAATLDRYRAIGIYVFVLRPTWGLVGDLTRGVDPLTVEYRAGLVGTASCTGCQQILREKEEWASRARATAQKAWWAAWLGMWLYIGKEVHMRSDDQTHAKRMQDVRDLARFNAWTYLWRRIAEDIVSTWWIQWGRAWRELGTDHARPYRWQRAWLEAWAAIGRLYAVDEASRIRAVVESVHAENARIQNWWPAWLRVWSEIGQRASGMTAAWKPICRRCRRDLTRDHQC